MTSLIDPLVELKTLLSDPRNWSQFAVARDKDKVPCNYWESTAVSWDIYGATAKIADSYKLSVDDFKELIQLIVNGCKRATGFELTVFEAMRAYNDCMSYEQIVDAINRAIATLDPNNS